MKSIIIFFSLLVYSGCLAQVSSGEIIYEVRVNPVSFFNNIEKSVSEQKQINKINSIIPTLKFGLIFNNKKSVFCIKKQMVTGSNDFHTEMAILLTQGDKTIFCDIQNRQLLEKTSFLGEEFLIKSLIDDLKWEITKEKKYIDTYLSFKAIAFKEIKVQNKLKRFDYVAWFCPEIPFRYGPVNIVGLPGMVLEFVNSNLIYKATEIKLSKNQISIEIPNEGKIVTKEEFDKIGKQAFENIKQ
jgi:GLPGLI family protein